MLDPRLRNKLGLGLYLALLTFAGFTLAFCCVRLSYTTTPRQDKFLFNGASFYEPSVAELLGTSILTIFWAVFLLTSLWRKVEHIFLTHMWFEYAMIGLLWFMWVGGTGAASTVWPNLSWCTQYSPCRVLQAMMGFAWLSWICVTLLAVLFIVGAVTHPDPGRWRRHGHVERNLKSNGSKVEENFAGSFARVPRHSLSSFRFPARPVMEQV